MRRWYDEERGIKMCEPDCVDEWLFDIWAIGCDYDGCHTAKDLKKLIDELVGMANKARECLWERRLFGDHGEPKPQTNADRIRAMSDEELAERMVGDVWDCCCCSEYDRIGGHPLVSDERCDEKCKEHCLDWLKQPVKDGDNDGP